MRKTATTTLQNYFRNNYFNNFNYIGAKHNIRNVSTKNYSLSDTLFPLIKKDKVNFISYENLIYFDYEYNIFSDYRSYQKKVIPTYKSIYKLNEELEKLKNKIDYKLDISIIIVLREQSSFIESYYKHNVKRKFTTKPFNKFLLDLDLDKFKYSYYINELDKLFKLKVFWYDDQVHYYKDIFKLLNIKYNINTNIINNKGINGDELKRIIPSYIDNIELFSDEEKKKLKLYFNEDNLKIKNIFE